ncbi:MAG: hypothetical protein JWO95_2884, partial [Verrucomicrobiales bacterium]|nr:hypothetical protein [Verrucomicrobiales bacterium]
IQSFNAATFQEASVAEAVALQRQEIVEWSARMRLQRELQWIAGQELLEAANGWLANFGDDQLEKVTLSQVTRAIVIGSKIGRMAIAGFENPLDAKSSVPASRSELLSPTTSPVPTKVSQSLQVEEPRSVSTTPIDLGIHVGTCEKIVSVTKGAEKCHLHSSSETDLPLQPTPGSDSQPGQRATNGEVCLSSPINRHSPPDKNILVPESAEKCPSGEPDVSPEVAPRSDNQPAMNRRFYFSPLAPRHSTPNLFQTPVPITDPRSTIKVSSCPSRRLRHSQKKVSVLKSARKCRSLPMMIKTRHVTVPYYSRSVSVTERFRTTSMYPKENETLHNICAIQ